MAARCTGKGYVDRGKRDDILEGVQKMNQTERELIDRAHKILCSIPPACSKEVDDAITLIERAVTIPDAGEKVEVMELASEIMRFEVDSTGQFPYLAKYSIEQAAALIEADRECVRKAEREKERSCMTPDWKDAPEWAKVENMNYEDAYLLMPWGKRHYRYKDINDTQYPMTVEVETPEGWEPCPNINVAHRIQTMLMLDKKNHVKEGLRDTLEARAK